VAQLFSLGIAAMILFNRIPSRCFRTPDIFFFCHGLPSMFCILRHKFRIHISARWHRLALAARIDRDGIAGISDTLAGSCILDSYILLLCHSAWTCMQHCKQPSGFVRLVVHMAATIVPDEFRDVCPCGWHSRRDSPDFLAIVFDHADCFVWV
jgi:hypothetical protein